MVFQSVLKCVNKAYAAELRYIYIYTYMFASVCLVLSTQHIATYKCGSICSRVCQRACLSAPLRGGVLAVEWMLELDDMAVPLAQKILLFSVILHQLSERGEFLASIQVIIVARVLDLNVGHLIVTPEWKKKTEVI